MLKAYYFYEMFVREGIPVWWDESQRVNFDVKRKVSRSRAAIDREEERDGKKARVPGQYYVPEPRTNDGNPDLPTFKEWQEEQRRLEGPRFRV